MTVESIRRTIDRIRAGEVAYCTRTELLDLCDEADAAVRLRSEYECAECTHNRQRAKAREDELRDREAEVALAVRQRDVLVEEVRELEDRLSRVRAAADGRP